MFRHMPFILISIIIAIVFLDPFIPLNVKQFLFTISLSIKSCIIMILPLIIFSLLFKTATTLSGYGAILIILVILILVCISNFLSTMLSGFIGVRAYNFNLSMIVPEVSNLKQLWSIELPTIVSNAKAMFGGIILGIVTSIIYPKQAINISKTIEVLVSKVLNFIVYIIPLFVAGFVIKLQADGAVWLIVKDYSVIFAIIAAAQFSYIFLAYFVFSSLKVKEFATSIKNLCPAAISGFTTMSSAASMPLTICGAEKNAKNKDLARSVIPATVNIHLVGDCFAIPILAYAILKSFGMEEPSFLNYVIFTFYFVLAKFSVAAIPGGGIIVMLPILESYLGFNANMMSLITALYILFDPVITCANVLGNGAFAKMIDRVSNCFCKKQAQKS
jgi:Na+/H+-dicarboxylate symporter